MRNIFNKAIVRKSIGVFGLSIVIFISSYAQITRSQMMATANSYSDASYSWTATSQNLDWNISCGGKIIHYANPSFGGCVIVGTNWGMPYCWGGFSSIAEHNSAMSLGRSAGDICPSGQGWCPGGGAGLTCASGLDCSGFVSKVWQIIPRTNCVGLGNKSTAINASVVQQGDIYNKTTAPEHVRLIKERYSNGNVNVVESSGRDWRTSYYPYTPAQLSNYVPRIYNILYNECSEPIALVVGSLCVNILATTINATASTPAPVGNCPTTGYKDVWFKFNMPNLNSPVVTIRTTAGSLTDAVMEVYQGTTCANKTYITCEDNNNSPGNGSLMPVINLQGGPNNTIWVRVWGKNGTTGTFNICVLNSTSNNFTGNGDGNRTSTTILKPEKLSEITERSSNDSYDLLSQLHVSPNPANDILNISFLQNENCYVSKFVLKDFFGKNVLNAPLADPNNVEILHQLNVNNVPSGVYLLQVLTSQGVISKKIIVAH